MGSNVIEMFFLCILFKVRSDQNSNRPDNRDVYQYTSLILYGLSKSFCSFTKTSYTQQNVLLFQCGTIYSFLDQISEESRIQKKKPNSVFLLTLIRDVIDLMPNHETLRHRQCGV